MRIDRILLCLFLLLSPRVVHGQPVTIGSELQVSTQPSGGLSPRIAADADGNFIVVWLGEQNGIFGQRFNSAGERLGTEFRVNTNADFLNFGLLFLRDVDISAGPDGDFVVVWSSQDREDDFSFGIFGQRFDSSGVKIGTEFQANSVTRGFQYYPAVAGGPNDGFVVAWENYDSFEPPAAGNNLQGRWFDSDGFPVGPEFQVGTYTALQSRVDITRRADGSFVFVWQDLGDAMGQIYRSDGSTAGAEFEVSTYGSAFQWFPTVRADRDGNFVVAWSSAGRDGDRFGMFGQRFDSAGDRIGTEFQINSYTVGSQYAVNHGLFVGPLGDFVVAWTTQADGVSFPDGIFAQKFQSTGEPLGTEFQIGSDTSGTQAFPAVSGGPDGFVIAWMSDAWEENRFEILGQRYRNEPFCPEVPAPDCLPASQSALVMRHRQTTTQPLDTMVWRWRRNPPADSETLSSPSNYLLCLYEGSGLATQARVAGTCGEDSCWSVSGGEQDGSRTRFTSRRSLRDFPRDRGLSKILIRGRGANLSLPALPMNDGGGLTVQLHRSNGAACLEAKYEHPALRNEADEYRTRMP